MCSQVNCFKFHDVFFIENCEHKRNGGNESDPVDAQTDLVFALFFLFNVTRSCEDWQFDRWPFAHLKSYVHSPSKVQFRAGGTIKFEFELPTDSAKYNQKNNTYKHNLYRSRNRNIDFLCENVILIEIENHRFHQTLSLSSLSVRVCLILLLFTPRQMLISSGRRS